MKDDKKSARRAQIEEAAYALIDEKGYAGTSMLAIAKRAKASNETLYNWYGDKLGLFSAMVGSNAETVRSTLRAALRDGDDPLTSLKRFGPALLEMLTGPRAVALNQAAAADATGQLGKALGKAGRNTVAPLVGEVLDKARRAGALHFDDLQDTTDLYLGLLIGDLQLRCVTGQIAPPAHPQRVARAARAVTVLRRLLSQSGAA